MRHRPIVYVMMRRTREERRDTATRWVFFGLALMSVVVYVAVWWAGGFA
jgi:hypothetical protein